MKVQKTGHSSPSICILSASQEATSCIGACYGYTEFTNDCCASEVVERFKWQSEYFFPPKLQSLLGLLDLRAVLGLYVCILFGRIHYKVTNRDLKYIYM